jgi:nitrite reductase/ring-hydroxylating ferredoxin subunit
MTDSNHSQNPDLTAGIPESELADGAMLVGQVGEEAVLLARRGAEIFAIGATCTHYGGPLGDGLMVDDTVRCPWHHACFSLRTGEALAAPALNAVSCWRIERRDGRIFVRDRVSEAGRPMPARSRPAAGSPERMVSIGGGGAGYAAAEMLRREGFGGAVTIVSADDAAPYDPAPSPSPRSSAGRTAFGRRSRWKQADRRSFQPQAQDGRSKANPPPHPRYSRMSRPLSRSIK